MFAIIAIAPNNTTHSEEVDGDVHDARRAVRDLERKGYTHFQVVTMPAQKVKAIGSRILPRVTG